MRVYVTTDAFEAETLIEDTESNKDTNKEPRHKYIDIELKNNPELEREIGFNPMCSIELDENVSENELEGIVAKLAKENLCVAVDINRKIQKYFPRDIEFRNALVELALRKERGKNMFEDSCTNLLIYSNNPNNIRAIDNEFYWIARKH